MNEKEIHSKFINDDINNAVVKILRLETEDVGILAFRIGGTIAWKAALKGLKISMLYGVSSTRLRYEIKNPDCYIHLLLSENDLFTSEYAWFQKLNLESEIIRDGQHDIYKHKGVIDNLCSQIKKHCYN